MSFDINWEKLTTDNSISESIKEFLDNQFQNISLPSYIDNLSVTDFSLGDQPPEVIIRHIGDPFNEFYEDEEDDGEEGFHDSKDGIRRPRAPFGEPFGEDEDEEEEEEDEARRSVRSDEEEDNEEVEDLMNQKDKTNDLLLSSPGSSDTSKPSRGGTPLQHPPPLERIRASSDSISLMLGNNTFNYLQNYNMNNIIGLGPNNNNGAETPTDILHQNIRMKNQATSNAATNSKLSSGAKSKLKSENDLQLIVEMKYTGNLQIQLAVDLLVNYPSPNFITLPIKLHITDLNIHAIAAVAYLKKAVFFSFLCDISDTNIDYFSSSNSTQHPDHTPTHPGGGNFVEYASAPSNKERIDIIKKVRIESEIGEVENNVLRNVGKVEKFLIDQLREILREEIAWPSWVCFDLADDEPEEKQS